jgi:hypothetical protein
MCFHQRGCHVGRLATVFVAVMWSAAMPRLVNAAVYHVDGSLESASDVNAGTETAPWRTIGRAATAQELRPGDTVTIHLRHRLHAAG